MKWLFTTILVFMSALSITIHADTLIHAEDYSSLNAAVDYISTMGGGTVIIPNTDYIVTETVYLKDNVSIVGQGNSSKLIINTDIGKLFVVEGTAAPSTTITSDITYDLYYDKSVFKIAVADASMFSIGDEVEISENELREYNRIINIDGNYIFLQKRPGNSYYVNEDAKVVKVDLVKNVTIKDLFIIDNASIESILYLDYAHAVNFENNTLKCGKDYKKRSLPPSSFLNKENTIWLNDVENIRISNNRIYNGSYAIFLSQYARLSNIDNNSLTNTWEGILICGSKNIVTANAIVGAGSAYGNGDGITIYNKASENIVGGNTIESGSCYGIWVTYGSPNRNVISNNIVRSNNAAGIAVSAGKDNKVINNIICRNSHGVLVQDGYNTVVLNNTIYDITGVGIYIIGGSTNTIITGNTATDCNTHSISLYYASHNILRNNVIGNNYSWGTGTNNIIEDNFIH